MLGCEGAIELSAVAADIYRDFCLGNSDDDDGDLPVKLSSGVGTYPHVCVASIAAPYYCT